MGPQAKTRKGPVSTGPNIGVTTLSFSALSQAGVKPNGRNDRIAFQDVCSCGDARGASPSLRKQLFVV